jgi:asparagine synthetase B (glutamine-hydrolysing)
MCGVLVYKEKGNNEYIKNRGEFVNKQTINGLTFVHTLLPITGEFTPQPFVDGDIVCLYNGEIYNHKFVKTDGENLIPLYKQFGMLFTRELDGEFAIAIYDFKEDLAIFITDPLGTKPLWRNGIECGSYHSGVGGRQIPPNTIEGVKISTETDLFRFNYHDWQWSQFKDTYDDWIKAFENAIKKRATPRCFIGLSSGYDSGAISKELTKQGIDFKAYSVMNNEDKDIILARGKYCYEFDEIKTNFKETQELLKLLMEDIQYKYSQEKYIYDDIGSVGLAEICRQANREGRRVCLSGQGADEIIGDYKLYPNQSNFKGIFPEELKEWNNFAGGFQRDYLNKEEYVGGAFGIETRYPFLDKDVVQEFLWLKPELKNRNYKAPIYEYLTRNKVPFNKETKRGFHPNTK